VISIVWAWTAPAVAARRRAANTRSLTASFYRPVGPILGRAEQVG